MRTPMTSLSKRNRGFTMIELIIGSAIMLVAVLGALAIYARSNRVSVDQQMITEVQNDVRAAMFFITRDLRMAGVGLPEEFAGYFLEGWDNEDQGGEVRPDRIRLMGNIDEPLDLRIQSYGGGVGGGAANIAVLDFSYEQYPYPESFYVGKVVLVLPNPESGCREGHVGKITQVIWSEPGTNEKLVFAPGLAQGINLPGGLIQDGSCPVDAWPGGLITFANVKEYWLDVTGNAVDPQTRQALIAGQDGYIGVGGVLYVTHNGIHFPLANNIENFQVEYDGDMDNDPELELDGWTPWQNTWTLDQTARISQIRAWILGRTPRAITSVGGTPPGGIHLYRRPLLSNSPAASADDRHRRFLLESTANVRNMSLNLYNLGQR